MIRKAIIISALLLAMTLTKATAQEISSPVLPRPNQLLWQQSGIGAVFHYDLHVFDGVRYSQPENRIRHYTVEAHTADGWTVLCEGRSVGSKRIECFSPVMTDKLRLTVTEAVSEPEIASFRAFRTENDTFSTNPSSYSAL